MGKVFEWVRLGGGKRLVQLRGTLEGGFIAECIEADDVGNGNVVAQGKGKSGDTALLDMSVSLRSKIERPAGAGAR